MSFLSDAEEFMKKRIPEGTYDETIPFNSTEEKNALIRTLCLKYPNASMHEIEHALEQMQDKFDPPYPKKEVMQFLRIKLED
ncbi:MAG: hypothetical protein EOM53_03920 [Alphaproteobacteria bacterium]|nr:hypothetical protein [Alphaproteobacteria bacterium]